MITVYRGTACRVKGSLEVNELIMSELGITEKSGTSRDGVFTLQQVRCVGARGLASGAQAVYEALKDQLSAKAPGARLVRTDCMESCYAEVMMELERRGSTPAIYSGVTPDMVAGILDAYLGGDVGGPMPSG